MARHQAPAAPTLCFVSVISSMFCPHRVCWHPSVRVVPSYSLLWCCLSISSWFGLQPGRDERNRVTMTVHSCDVTTVRWSSYLESQRCLCQLPVLSECLHYVCDLTKPRKYKTGLFRNKNPVPQPCAETSLTLRCVVRVLCLSGAFTIFDFCFLGWLSQRGVILKLQSLRSHTAAVIQTFATNISCRHFLVSLK